MEKTPYSYSYSWKSLGRCCVGDQTPFCIETTETDLAWFFFSGISLGFLCRTLLSNKRLPLHARISVHVEIGLKADALSSPSPPCVHAHCVDADGIPAIIHFPLCLLFFLPLSFVSCLCVSISLFSAPLPSFFSFPLFCSSFFISDSYPQHILFNFCVVIVL